MKTFSKKISVISLGCDKNRIDTETMLAYLIKGGHILTDNYDEAEIIVVNTCAFIESARIEAIDTILGIIPYKKKHCEKIIITGCLPQKYSSDIESDMPEVDAFLGTANYENICTFIERLYLGERLVQTGLCDNFQKFSGRIVTTPAHYAYLKIADGCDNFCTYCTIPSIRGKYRSRPIEVILKEAEFLIDGGAKEIILVAQDVTKYGYDLYGDYKLVELIRSLSRLPLSYIRLMYCYPELMSDLLIEEIASNSKVAKYVDIPMQHADDEILKLMNRRNDGKQAGDLIEKIRKANPAIAIRTTFIVGFPGESQEHFNHLLNFVSHYAPEHVGVFAYSAEEDTPSYKLPNHIDDVTKAERGKALGETHLNNVRIKNRALIGQVVEVLYEDIDYEKNMFIGRTQQDAPEIDGLVYFKGTFADVGNFYKVKITGYDDYDLIGERIE